MTTNEFNFLQEHSLHFLEMAFRTDHQESIKNPDGYGKNTGACRDTVEIFFKVHDNRLCFISYITNGCMNTNACANTIVELAEGKTIEAAWKLAPEDVITYLETLPPANHHCAELAVGALYRALTNYNEMQKNPWKARYRR